MGSSPGSDDTPAPAQQGPPIEQLRPAQPPPNYPQFIQGGGPNDVQHGLTPQMLAAINANAAPSQPAEQPLTAGGAGATPDRSTLAQMLVDLLQPTRPEDPRRWAEGGRGDTSGGRAGLGGQPGIGGGMGGVSSGGIY